MEAPEKKKHSDTWTEVMAGSDAYNEALDDMHKWIDEAPIEEAIEDNLTGMGEIANMEELIKSIRDLLKGTPKISNKAMDTIVKKVRES